ncbi:MAG TPA: acyl carrier protein [Candidatus Angelobacter sp.]|nr:acyl carrier protein [Candidatus Angelobacter sp.]
MPEQPVVVNLDLKMREIIAEALAIGVDEIYSDQSLSQLGADPGSESYVWRRIEEEFDIAVTLAQRGSLKDVGAIIHYLKWRLKGVPR